MAVRAATIKAIVTAETQQAEAGLRRMEMQVSGFGQAAGEVFDGMGLGLARFAGPAAIGAAIVGMGKAALSLEQMREESAQLEARFAGFTGGVAQADAAFRAFDSTLGNALSKDQKMAAATQLLGLGLAGTAREAATLTRQALVLGIDLDQLTQSLATGRANGLVPYGISMTEMKTRADALMASTAGLSETEARAIAIKEQLAAKAQAVEEMGGRAATQVTELKNAWETLKDTAADKVQLEVVLSLVTQAISNTSFALSDQGQTERDYQKAFEAYQAAALEAAKVREFYNQAVANGNEADAAQAAALLGSAEAAEAAALAQYENAQALQDTALNGDAAAESMQDVTTALGETEEAVGQVSSALAASMQWFGEWAGFAEASAAAAKNSLLTQAAEMQTRFGVAQDYIGPTVLEYNKAAGDKKRAEIEEWRRQQLAANRDAARDFSRQYEQAADDAGNAFKDAMSQAQQFSIGLGDLRPGGDKGLNAPGQNGAFEALYRAQSIAVHGTGGANEAAWAQQYGLTQESAREIVRKFQAGLWDASVMALVDKGKLTEQIEQAKLAQTMMDAVAADLAKASGGDAKLIKAMLGMGGGADGGAAGKAAAGVDLSGFAPGFLASIDQEITKNAGDFEKRGKDLFDKLGAGFVKQATESGIFRQGVTAIIESVLAEGLA